MTEQTPAEFLKSHYEQAMTLVGSKDTITSHLTENEQSLLNIVLRYSEQAKAVLTVLITSLVYKIFNPTQDVRKHQVSIAGGYSGEII